MALHILLVTSPVIQNSTGNAVLIFRLWFIQSTRRSRIVFSVLLVLSPLIAIEIKTFNTFEGRLVVLWVRWMPSRRGTLWFRRINWWASLSTRGSTECTRACISRAWSWRLKSVTCHSIPATWNSSSPWRSTWPPQKIRAGYLNNSNNSQSKKLETMSNVFGVFHFHIADYELWCPDTRK